MRLFEAILAAHERLAAGRQEFEAPPLDQFASELPIAALTCIDPRLNQLVPDALGLPEEKFIWLRNAGNIITSPLSSTMRSLALACAVKGAKEIAVIGHTDCQVCKTSTMQLLENLAALGVDRHKLPENLVDYFGLFGSERQNVIRGVDFIRASPLIGTKIPVHGLLIDIKTGRLEWVVNGYQNFAPAAAVSGKTGELLGKAEGALAKFDRIGHAAAEEFKLPEAKIGEIVSTAEKFLHRAEKIAATVQNEITPPPVQKAVAAPVAAASTPGDRLRLLAKTVRDMKTGARR